MRVSALNIVSTLCDQPIGHFGVWLAEVKTLALRQLVHDRPKVYDPLGKGVIRALGNMYPVEPYLGSARSLIQEVYHRSVGPALGIHELPWRRLLKAYPVGSGW